MISPISDAVQRLGQRFRRRRDEKRTRAKQQQLRIEPLEDRRLLAQTVGLFVNNADESYEGYTLWGPLRDTTTYLIDNDGKLVHSWESDYAPNANYLLEDGTLLRTAQLRGLDWGAGGSSGRVEQLDWDGNVIWSYELATNKYLLHHDLAPILNPDGSLHSVLMIAWHKMTRAEALAAGRNPNNLTDAANNGELWSERIIEVVPDYSDGEGGTIVWDWFLKDHLVSNNVAAHPELVDINYEPPEGNAVTIADWTHFNGIDYNPITDQIMISSRDFSELWVLDHSTTTAEAATHSGGNSGMGGDILFRWGNPAAYGRGTRATQKLFHQHNAVWIPPGHPGEGNILVFNNGSFRPDGSEFSTVIEITPPVNRQWYFNNRINGTNGDLNIFNTMSDVPSSWVPMTGDWDKDGEDTGGFYDPENQKFYLNNYADGTLADIDFVADPVGVDNTWKPVAGDWDNDGYDTVGLYDPATNNWYLSNGMGVWGDVVEVVAPAAVPATWLPLAGDWNGNGFDTIGFHDPANNAWTLNNKIDGSATNVIAFNAPTPHPTWKPVVGDWNGNGRDTVGLYDVANHRWYLNNKTDGTVNSVVVINASLVPAAWRPITGDWNGNGFDSVGLYNPKYIDGNFTILPGKAFGPSTPTWEYVGKPKSSFFSSIISGSQRLPNGNTLVDEGVTGRIFEVTPGGKIVWEYINPVTNAGPLDQGDVAPQMGALVGVQTNLVFRALRYPVDYAGLEGKDLTPGDPIEGYPASYDTGGLYSPNSFDWSLNNHVDGTRTDKIDFNSGFAGGIVVAGDWDNDGIDTVGLYDPALRTFFLNNATDGTYGDTPIVVDQAGVNANWRPIVGDWNNDGFDTPGLYDPATSNWYLSDAVGDWGDVTTLLAPNRVPNSWQPIAGDWDGANGDSVGFYNPNRNRWILNNDIDGSIDDLIVFNVSKPRPAWKPITGDWNGNGVDTVGLFNPSNQRWYLNNATDGSVNDLITYRIPGWSSSSQPVAGDWNGSKAVPLTLAANAASAKSLGAAPLTEAALAPVLDEALARIAASEGLDALAALGDATVVISNLAGSQLGRASVGSTIQIDVDAAGAGWFVDATPSDDVEFASSGDAVDGVDLLSVLTHELSHLLGKSHGDDGLTATLSAGTRRLDGVVVADEMFAQFGA